MRNVFAGILCFMLWGSAPLAHAQKADSSIFAGDERLARKVSVHAEGIPVGDLLRQLSTTTGITLEATADIAEEKVVVFSPLRPLRETLEDLAALFNNRWKRTEVADNKANTKSESRADSKPAYTFYRPRQAEEFAAALAERDKRYVLSILEQQIRALREDPAQLARRKDDDPIRTHLSDPVIRAATEFFALLSSRQRQQLVERGYLPPAPLRSYPPSQQNALRELAIRGTLSQYDSVGVEPEFVEGENTPPNPAQRAAELARIKEEVRQSMLEMLNTAIVRYFYRAEGSSVVLEIGSYTANIGSFYPPEVEFKQGDPYTGKPNPKNIALPEQLDLTALTAVKDWIDRLRQLAEATGRPLFSDFHRVPQIGSEWQRIMEKMGSELAVPDEETPPGIDDGPPPTEEKPVTRPIEPGIAQEPPAPEEPPTPLDTFVGRDEHYWWPRGNTLLFRLAKWYDADKYEPPDSWVLKTAQQLKAQNGIPTYNDITSLLRLTPHQITGLSMLYSSALAGAGGGMGMFSMFQGPNGQSSGQNVREILAILNSASPNPRQPLQRGDFPMLEQFQMQMDWMSQIYEARGRNAEGLPEMPKLPPKPGTIFAAQMPIASQSRLREFLYALPNYDPALDVRQIGLRVTYQLGAAASLDSIPSLFSPAGMPNMDTDVFEQMQPPDENASEEERKAFSAKYSAMMGEYMKKFRNWYEERLKSILKTYPNYAEMERSKTPGRPVILLWVSAFSENREISEDYTATLPLALADDRRDRTRISLEPKPVP